MSGPPFTVKAVFEYTSDHEDDLTFSIGQIITVTEEEDAEWFFGKYTDDAGSKHEGIFPRNFVEKYDPPAPPRPSRPSRSKKEAETTSHATGSSDQPAADTVAAAPRKSTDSGRADIEAKSVEHEVPVPEEPPAPTTVATTSPLPSPPAQEPVQRASQPDVQKAEAPKTEKPSEKSSKKPPPPAVAEKPSGGSFKDRIAAFNKASAAPMPFNPGAHQTSANNFVKKPFVAPPPSKNAYVPLPAEKPQTIYRREEDQSATEHQTQGNVVTERSQPTVEPSESGEEDQPKPTSLKERIALLQKQQLEQAARHAEAAQKKEKPKKPQKKKVEQQDAADQAEPSQSLELQRTETSETAKQAAEGESQAENIPHRQRPPPPVTQPPARELTSDTNDADYSGAGDTEEADETSTSKEDFDERPAKSSHQERPPAEHSDKEEKDNGDGDDSGEEAAEDEEIDPEIKRRMELRERMAKISGGMGMMGMFGAPPGGMPGMPGMPTGNYKKPKPPTPGAEASEQPSSPTMQAPPVPLMALPGMHSTKPQEPPQTQAKTTEEDEEHDEEDHVADKSQGSPVEARHDERSSTDNIAESRPSTSNDTSMPTTANLSRPVPPPVADRRTSIPPPPLESRPVPAPPTQMKASPTTDDESDGEIPGPAFSREPKSESQQESHIDNPPSGRPTTSSEKRSSLGQPPPLPPLASPPLPAPAQSRPPPPPPPVPVSRKSTSDSRISARTPTPLSGHNSEDEVTEYEGDYDTDIASSAKHKDALKAHGRNSSVDEGTITDEVSGQSPKSPVETRPPIPSTLPPRGMPPPPPSQPPKSRQSSDMPRGPPPPIPPPKGPQDAGEDEYDPFRHDIRPNIVSRDSNNSRAEESPTLGESQFQPSSARQSFLAQPPPPPPSHPPGQPPRTPGRQSVDLLRGQGGSRRSMDVSRPSMDLGHIASDVDLGQGTLWWTQPNTPPPAFQNRRDVLFEIEESGSQNQGGQATVSKDVYVLFMDYSQTVVSVQFDAQNPQDAMLEQRHEPPPPRLRQDQLENAHAQFGTRISEGVASVQNTVVGDGTPHGLIQSLLAPFSDALKPVGVRAYGALVYTNLANASVQQYDEIRPGDIITFRNSRFQGHRGTMHQKYSTEAGKPDHVGVVYDWDGTKKKLRVWEQGRESKKVKVESFKLNDLRSGECRIWRVMPRGWIGWDGGHKA